MKFDSLNRDLEDAGTKMDDSDKIRHLLLTLPSVYDSVIVALETTTNDLNLDFMKVL